MRAPPLADSLAHPRPCLTPRAALIKRIGRIDKKRVFQRPVLEEAPGLSNNGRLYAEVVAKPMDMRTVSQTLDRGGYPSFEAFEADLEQIVKNAEGFWGEQHRIAKLAKKVFRTQIR